MKVQEYFNNVFAYAYGVEKWIKDYFKSVGFEPKYTFASDLAIADWLGKDAVKDTYQRIKEDWIEDYRAFTEAVMEINMLSWANDQLINQGFEGREEWVTFYSDLYYQARNDFYEKYEGNEEACDYFFRTTD